MTFRLLLLTLIFLISLNAKPPELTPRDARIKIEEILRAHATYHSLNQELMQRTFTNFLQELDPSKTYLLESEVAAWAKASQAVLTRAIQGIKKEDFSVFEEMHAAIVRAIGRRPLHEEKVNAGIPPKDVHPDEFKDVAWAKTEEELITRLLRIKGLQISAAEKLDEKGKTTFLQRVEKRRATREDELRGDSPLYRQQTMLSTLLKAVSGALDSQTTYFTPTEASQFMIQVQQRLFGIGVQLRDDLNGLSVMRILEGGPAAQDDKLKLGDLIIAVNGEPIIGMDISEGVSLIRGAQGTSVLLTVLRRTGEEEQTLEVELQRGEVVLKDTRLESTYEPFGEDAIGIIRLFSFYQDPKFSSTSDVLEAIQQLKAEHRLKGIILDLRSNAGGLLPQAVSVAGLFMNKGVVVSIKDNTGMIQRLRNIESKMAWDGPLIILVNRASASAAEIVTQTLQEYGRAIVVGDKSTYGKGTFQTFTLEATNFGTVNPKGEYKVTRGRYYTVSGKSPQLVGAQSDIIVPSLYSKLDIGEEHAKFPLGTDQIAPSFEDDLSDIPAIHRHQVMRLYKFNLQQVMTTYQPHLPLLQQNSSIRLQINKNYQNLFKEIARKEMYAEPIEKFGESDLQMQEALNIMKDLLILQKPSAK